MTHGRAKHRRRLRTALAVCLVLMVQAGALAAVIIQVSTYQELIDAASSCNEDDIIELTANLTRKGDETANVAKITANGVTVRSSAGNQFLINNGDDGTGQPITGRLLEVENAGNAVNGFTLQNVAMSGGSTVGDGESGGALYVHGDDATISHCAFTDNHTEGRQAHGGGAYIYGVNAKIEDSTFKENYTKGYGANGGGAAIVGAGAQVVDSRFEQNQTTGQYAYGGGAAIEGNNAQVVDTRFEQNQTTGQYAYGGGAFIGGINAQVMHSTFEQNQTTGQNAHGGGAYIIGADTTIEGSTFEGNQAKGTGSTGGGVYYNTMSAVSATIKDTDFYGNTSTTGGGAITGPNTAITIWGVNYYQGNTPPGSTAVDVNGEDKLVGIWVSSVTLEEGAQVIEGRRPAPVDEAQIVGAGPNNRASRYTARRDLPVYRQETAGSERTGTLPAGTETTVMQISGGMALTPKGYVEFAGLTRVTGQ